MSRIMLRSLLAALVSFFSWQTGGHAADLPLGQVESVKGDRVEVAFDQDSGLGPDDMLAIYGPGKVEKHPLTKEVIVEQRQQVAKMQVLQALGDNRLQGRLTWTAAGVTVAQGFDAVPLPGEASPDSPPVLTAESLPSFSAIGQGRETIVLPLGDPEAGPLSCTWRLKGPAGATGRLDARTTAAPMVKWFAPTHPVDGLTLEVVARDVGGQQQTWNVELSVDEIGDSWRQRNLKVFARTGAGADAAWQQISRSPAGHFYAIADDRSVSAISSGWSQFQNFSAQDLRSPVSIQQVGDEVYILDGSERTVLVYSTDGVLRRQVGAFSGATDCAVNTAGEIHVADQGQGGVMVFERDGRLRCRLGYAGEDGTGFATLTRLAVDRAGTCYALDVEANRVQVFDKHHRRGKSLTIPTNEDNPPVDLAPHPEGLMVLLQLGQVLIFDAKGDANRSLPPLSDLGWFDRLSEPTSIEVDGNGEIYVTYPEESLVVRYGRDGKIAGVRGPELWELDRFAVDGKGMVYGLSVSTGLISAFDQEGWLVRRFGGTERYGGSFERPGPMAVSADGKWLCVLDERRYCVLRFNLQRPGDRELVFGQEGKNNGQFESVTAIALDEYGRAYVLDEDLHRVSVFDAEDGSYLFHFGSYQRGKTASELIRPEQVAVDANGDVAYIYDARRYELMKFELDHKAGSARHVTNGGGRGREVGQFSSVVDLACDRFGLLYVLDSSNKNLQVIDFRGSNAVPVLGLTTEDMGVRYLLNLALGPDGHPWINARGSLAGLRWKSR